MPVEAKESTTAIRRAVSEQINALKELSDIVAKSGPHASTFPIARAGASGAAPAPPPRPSREPPRRRAAPARPRRRSRRAAPAPAAPSPRLRAARLDLERPAEATPGAPRATASAPQGGWVRDLLSGASREEDDAAGAVAERRRRPAAAPSARRCRSWNR